MNSPDNGVRIKGQKIGVLLSRDGRLLARQGRRLFVKDGAAVSILGTSHASPDIIRTIAEIGITEPLVLRPEDIADVGGDEAVRSDRERAADLERSSMPGDDHAPPEIGNSYSPSARAPAGTNSPRATCGKCSSAIAPNEGDRARRVCIGRISSAICSDALSEWPRSSVSLRSCSWAESQRPASRLLER
jgi:hypothetical protein